MLHKDQILDVSTSLCKNFLTQSRIVSCKVAIAKHEVNRDFGATTGVQFKSDQCSEYVIESI